jgi:hypothetical protein
MKNIEYRQRLLSDYNIKLRGDWLLTVYYLLRLLPF